MDYRVFAETYAPGFDRIDIPDQPVETHYPDFDGRIEDVTFVHEGEWRAGTGSDKYPVMATGGLQDCIGILLYDEARQEGFLSHASARDPETVNRNDHLAAYWDAVRNKSYDFDLTMVVGNNPSPRVYASAVRELLNAPRGVNIDQRELLYTGWYGTVGIDLRDGVLTQYRGEDPATAGLLTGGAPRHRA